MKFLQSIYLVLIIPFLISCQCERDIVPDSVNGIRTSFFTADMIERICPNKSCDAVRIYSAFDIAVNKKTVMAVGVLDSADMKNADYYYYKNIASGNPQVDVLDRKRAIVVGKLVPLKERFAVTFPRHDILALCASGAASGVSFTSEILPTHKLTTLDAKSAKIVGNVINHVQGGGTLESDHPCPIYCGKEPSKDFLIDLNFPKSDDDQQDDPNDEDVDNPDER